MTNLAEDYKAIAKLSQRKRGNNREQSPNFLNKAGIPFESKNGGVHLIVEGSECFIDYWPGTGKWISRNGKRGFGVKNLIRYIEAAI